MTSAYKRKSLPPCRRRSFVIRKLIEAFISRRDAPADCFSTPIDVLQSLVGIDYVQQSPEDPGFPPAAATAVTVAVACESQVPLAAAVTTSPCRVSFAVRRKIRFAKKVE